MVAREKWIEEVIEHVEQLNKESKHAQFYPRVSGDFLLGIEVRFYASRRKISNKEVQHHVANKIEKLSRRRLFVADSSLIEYGMIDIRTASMHRYCESADVNRALDYIAGDMLEEIRLYGGGY